MKCSKEKYIYSHELMYLSVIKQKQTISFVKTISFVTYLFQSANVNAMICFKSV